MWQLVVYILRFGFTIAGIFALNCVLLLGLRDIIYFILPIGPPTIPRLKSIRRFSFTNLLTLKTPVRIVFWVAFAFSAGYLHNYFLYFSAFIFVSYFLLKAAEKKWINHGWLILLCSLLIFVITLVFINNQPVLLRINKQFSIDLWIYNASNSLIDAMIAAGQRFGLNTSGIERMAGLVPWAQKNIAALFFVSIYLFCGAVSGRLAKMILPGTSYTAPAYYNVPPLMPFALAAAAVLIASRYAHIPQIVFAVAAVYYIWGANAAIHFLRGGHWALNLFIVFAGALHPVSIAFFIALGVIDNLFDLRRSAAVLGVGTDIP